MQRCKNSSVVCRTCEKICVPAQHWSRVRWSTVPHAGTHSSRDWGSSLRKSLETVLGELKEDSLHSLELRVLRKGGRCDHSL